MNPPYVLIFIMDGQRREYRDVDAQTIIERMPFATTAFNSMLEGKAVYAHGGRYTLEVDAKQI